MQNYAKLGDIDPYSLHNKCIISVIILLYSMKFFQKPPPQKKKNHVTPWNWALDANSSFLILISLQPDVTGHKHPIQNIFICFIIPKSIIPTEIWWLYPHGGLEKEMGDVGLYGRGGYLYIYERPILKMINQ